MLGKKEPLPTEATEQVPSTPTASAAVGIKNTATFNDRAMDDSDETKPTTGQAGTNRSRRNVSLYAVWNCLRDYPKQVVSLTNKERSYEHA